MQLPLIEKKLEKIVIHEISRKSKEIIYPPMMKNTILNIFKKIKGENAMRQKYELCYQCKKCSAGCPLSSEMDLLPHQIMHYLTLGMVNEVLKSKTIWLCAGCYTCAMRCPNDIIITAVMDEVRELAMKNGAAPAEQDIKKFHKIFINSFKNAGRAHEVRMMAEYNLRTGNPFNNSKLAMKLLTKGRLKPLPPKKIKGFKKYMRNLWK